MARIPNISMPVSSHRSTWSGLALKCRLGVWLFVVLATYTSSAPINGPAISTTPKPRWKNPCGIQGHLFNPEEDLKGAPDLSIAELFDDIIRSARKAHLKGLRKKNAFVREAFNESEFENGVEDRTESWLPKIPELTKDYLENLERDKALRTTYEMLQFFAVGLEQTILDQLDRKQFLGLFREAEYELIELLCDLQRVMLILRVTANPDVERIIMKQKRRNILAESHRNVRDYLIFRDYIKAAEYVVKVFNYLKSKL